jgi:hypothetical protein
MNRVEKKWSSTGKAPYRAGAGQPCDILIKTGVGRDLRVLAGQNSL